MFSVGRDGYPEGETTTNDIVGIVEVLSRDSALVRFDDGTAQVESNAHALDFGGKESLVKAFHDLWRQAFSCVTDREMNCILGVQDLGNDPQFHMSTANWAFRVVY